MTVKYACVSHAAAETSEHSGRPVSSDADVREREAQRRGPPVGRERAAGVCGALQSPGLLPHHHVCHRNAKVRALWRPLWCTTVLALLVVVTVSHSGMVSVVTTSHSFMHL